MKFKQLVAKFLLLLTYLAWVTGFITSFGEERESEGLFSLR